MRSVESKNQQELHKEYLLKRREVGSTKYRKKGDLKFNSKAYQTYRRHRRLYWLNKYKIAKGCSSCGYNSCAQALDFNHIDPSTKLFNASSGRLSLSLKNFFAEVRKCVLLCANCHREHTYKTKQFFSGKGGTCGA